MMMNHETHHTEFLPSLYYPGLAKALTVRTYLKEDTVALPFITAKGCTSHLRNNSVVSLPSA